MSTIQTTQGSKIDFNLMSSQKRFADIDEKEVENMGKAKFRKKIVESTTAQVNILKAFAEQTYPEKNMDKQALSKEKLANVLQKLYKRNWDYYKLTAFEALRQGLARHFRETKKWDILKESEFHAANTTHYNMQRKLKQLEKGKIDHHQEIQLFSYWSSIWQSFAMTCPARAGDVSVGIAVFLIG